MGELLRVFVPKCLIVSIFKHGLPESQITVYRDYPAAQRSCAACKLLASSRSCNDPEILSLTVEELDGDVGNIGGGR